MWTGSWWVWPGSPRPVVAHPFVPAFLQDPLQLALQFEWDFSHFTEKKRVSFRGSKAEEIVV